MESQTSERAIPVVDLQADGSLEQIAEACKEWGFFQVTNHGIDQQLLDDAARSCCGFFNLPLEEKLKLSSTPPLGFVHQSQQGGMLENRQHLLLFGIHSRWPNSWPDQPSFFRSTMEELLSKLAPLATLLVGSVLDSLKLPKECLGQLYKRDSDALLNHFYPGRRTLNHDRPSIDLALSTHKDNSILTLVYQQNQVDALQVLKDEEWINIKPLKGAFIANIGDTFEVWTNGKYKSVKHRVVATELDRHSMSYFVSADSSMEIAPLRQFTLDLNQAPRYKAFVHGDYVKARNENKKQGNKEVVTLDKYKI